MFTDYFFGVWKQITILIKREIHTILSLIEKIFEEKNLKNGFTGIFDAFGEMISSKESNEVVRQEINPITGKPEPTFPVTMLRGELTPEEKSYDLDKVLKVFATMAISFKHKSKVEDQIRLANQVISLWWEKLLYLELIL